MITDNKMMPMADLAGQITGTAFRSSNAALATLLAEMQALGTMLPGVRPMTEAEAIAHDAEVEASFDNMPV